MNVNLAADSRSLTLGRRDLATANVKLAEATAVRDGAQQAYNRLALPQRLIEEAVAELAAEKAIYDAQIVTWYTSGCIGTRPPAPPSLLNAEHKVGEARRDLGASGSALETARTELQSANEELARLHLLQRGALYRAAVEAAQWRLYTKAIPSLIASLAELGVIESLRVELQNRGYGADPHPEASNASHHVAELLKAARQSTSVRGNLDAARQFLNELSADPYLELPDPGEPVVEDLQPWVTRPAVDGTYINNAVPEAKVPPLGMLDPVLDPAAAQRAFWRNPEREALIRAEAGTPEPAGEVEAVNAAPSPLPETAGPSPTFGPAQDMTIPPWIDTGWSGFRPPVRRG